jgi:phosphatidylserine/phosphatidylglycerophosphate/cardiolipin synthase-like enzyme
MRKLIYIALIALGLLPTLTIAAEPYDCRVQSQFSSQGSVGTKVLQAVSQTKERLTLALYGFDNTELANELLKLVKSHVMVRLKVDAKRSASKKITKLVEDLKAGGVQVQTVAPDGRNHNKFAVIDRKRVLTGSYNWTLKAESNWENLLILDCPDLAKAYETEWERIH